jgi:uncharacterized protein YciI
MFFVIDCRDKPGHLAVRLENRDAHLNYLKDFEQQLIMAGPFMDADNQMIGSMLIMAFNDHAEADSFCAADPYALAGLFERVQIRPWRKVLPA